MNFEGIAEKFVDMYDTKFLADNFAWSQKFAIEQNMVMIGNISELGTIWGPWLYVVVEDFFHNLSVQYKWPIAVFGLKLWNKN